MERLACTVADAEHPIPLEVHIFDKSGHFGSGEIHRSRQSPTSFLNRVAGHVAFAADESVVDAGPLLPKEVRPTLYEWCRRKLDETGDARFDITPETWPPRYLHGLALEEAFERYVALLREQPGVSVELHEDEVVDLVELGDSLRVVTAADPAGRVVADHVLLLTGHSYNDPARLPKQGRWRRFAERTGARFEPSAYPLEKIFTDEVSSPRHVVGLAGTMLTGIDAILFLTEGRGGRFVRSLDGVLRYNASGREPGAIVAFSASALFPFARPINVRGKTGGGPDRGTFLNVPAVEALRESCGAPQRVGEIDQRQLDYERDVFPLVVLEMAYLYYATLLGEEFARHLVTVLQPRYEAFLAGAMVAATGSVARAWLHEPLEAAVDAAADVLDPVLTGAPPLAAHPAWSLGPVLDRYLTVVYGSEVAKRVASVAADPAAVAAALRGVAPAWRHAPLVRDNRFSWEGLIDPIRRERCRSPEAYRAALADFMRRDLLWAAQGNVDNPAKVAAEGVWRDLRPVVVAAVNYGGLHSRSHRAFMEVWLRQHNRLSYGPNREVIEKMLALVEHGLLDMSAGPNARVETEEGRFVVHGPVTGARRAVDLLVDARVHPFDAEMDVAPLYPNMLRRGLVQKWRNPGTNGDPGYEPGGLDLTDDFHPIRPDGRVDERLGFLGPSIEGKTFFRGGALKPHANHHAMQNILLWSRSFWRQVEQAAVTEEVTA